MNTDTPTYAYLERINHLLTALSRVNRTILRVRNDETELLREAGKTIRNQLGYDVVWLGVVNDGRDGLHRGEIITAISQYNAGGALPRSTDLEKASADIAASPGLPALAIRCAALGEKLIGEPLALPTEAAGASWRAAAFPVRINTSCTFVLTACTQARHSSTEEEVRILEEIARDLGFALETMAVESRTRQAESALQISEERFRRLSENSMVGIVLIQNDLYRYVNPAFAKMFGYASPSEIIDRLGPTDLAAPESRDVVQENVEKRVLGQVRSAHFQYRGLKKDSTRFDVEEYGARTVHAQRLAIIATVLDVTAREASRRRLEALSEAGLSLATARDVQEALANATEQVTRILPCDSANIVLLAADALKVEAHAHAHAHAGAGDKPETLSVERRSLLNRTVEEIPVFKRIASSEQPAIVGSLASLRSNSTPTEDGRAEHAMGEFAGAPLVVRGQLIGLLIAEAGQSGQFSDEDARHLRLFADHVAATLQHLRLISSLEEERNRLQTLNRVSHTLSETLQLREVADRAIGEIGRALTAEISLLYLWDPVAESLSAVAAKGMPAPQAAAIDNIAALNARLISSEAGVMGPGMDGRRTDLDTRELGPSELEALQAQVLETETARRLGNGIGSALHVPLEAHGEFIGLLAFLSSAPDSFSAADAELVQALGVQVALAIQNARFYEHAARQAEAMAEALHRQEELDMMKDELIQNISHELRTPLALVMGYAEMLDSGNLGPVSEEQATAISVIARRTRMLRSLVEDIALLWNLERRMEEREPVDLRTLVETTVDEFTSQAQARDLTLSSALPAEPVEISGVRIQIRRVLDNLIGNALKFTPPGGQIQTELAIDDAYAELSVTDNGIGVPQEKLRRIFERFYQVDGSPTRKHGGTGLGLALVKAIVEAHDGTVHATSPVHDDLERPGTRITVRFQLSDASRDP